MNEIVYHRIAGDQIEILIDYRIKFLIEFGGPQPDDVIAAFKVQNRIYFEKAINDKSMIAYLAKQNNSIAGIGCMVIREQPGNFKNLTGRVGYLMNMYIVPEFRRKGICTGILRSLLKDACQMDGICSFELHATKEGEPVYIKNGFLLHNEPTYRKFVTLDSSPER